MRFVFVGVTFLGPYLAYLASLRHWGRHAFLALLALAQFAKAQDLTTSEIDREAKQLAQILASHVTVLDRELLSFHYENRGTRNNLHNISEVQKYLALGSNSFYLSDKQDPNDVGPGLYVALDPYSTRGGYGGRSPQLYVVPLLPGAHLLDLNGRLSQRDHAALAQSLSPLCGTVSDDKWRSLFEMIVTSLRTDCHEVLNKAMAANSIQGIFYGYDGADLVDCRKRDYAINIISSSIIDMSKVALFADDRHFEGQPLYGNLGRAYSEAQNAFTTRFYSYYTGGSVTSINPPKSLQTTAASNESYESWKRKYLYGCGNRWMNESDSDLIQASYMRTSFAPDAEIQDLLVSLRTAYMSRRSYGFFRISNIRQLEHVQIQNLGLNSAEALRWVKSDLAYTAIDENERYPLAELMLGEFSPKARAVPTDIRGPEPRAIYSAGLRTVAIRRDLLLKVFQRANYGPKLSQLMLLTVLDESGSVEPMSVAAAQDVNLENKPLQAQNRQQFKKMLLNCTKMYLDKSLSDDQIAASLCGISQNPN